MALSVLAQALVHPQPTQILLHPLVLVVRLIAQAVPVLPLAHHVDQEPTFLAISVWPRAHAQQEPMQTPQLRPVQAVLHLAQAVPQPLPAQAVRPTSITTVLH